MRLLFLIPLTTGLISGYIFKKSADEMAYLTGLVTLISLVLSLVLAPWQIQLVILAVVIISTRNLLRLNEYKMQIENSQDEQLNQSSASNKPNVPEAHATEGEKVGMYRGTPLKINQIKISPSRQTSFNLKYRGASISGQKDATL